MGYAMVRWLARALLALFYRRVEVDGLDRVPRRGPLVVVANHQNGLVDGLLLLAVLPRRLRPVAKAPLFGHPIVGPFLRLLGGVAVERRHDIGSDPSRNPAALAAAARSIADGGAVLIFPEGLSQHEPRLMPLRTGTARLVLAAERQVPGVGVCLVPVGLSFHRPGEFRAGRALVVIGPPIQTVDLVARAPAEPEPVVRALTERMAQALRALIVEADDRRTLELLAVAHGVWSGGAAVSDRELADWSRLALRHAAALPPASRERVARLRRDLERLEKDSVLAPAGAYALGTVARYAMREGGSLLLGAPLALAGLAVHGPAWMAVALLVRALRPAPDVAATYTLVAATVLFPLTWTVEAALAARLASGLAAAAFILLVPLTGFFAIAWRDRWARVGRDVGAFARFLVDHDLTRRIAERRRWVRAELAALAVPAGTAPR
jgi:1-acyl-sn-glycerol-3-phosphate acyltransferase